MVRQTVPFAETRACERFGDKIMRFLEIGVRSRDNRSRLSDKTGFKFCRAGSGAWSGSIKIAHSVAASLTLQGDAMVRGARFSATRSTSHGRKRVKTHNTCG